VNRTPAESTLFGRTVATAGAFLGSRAFPVRLLSTFFPTPFVGFPFVLKRAAPVTNHRIRRILSAILTVIAEHAVGYFNFRAAWNRRARARTRVSCQIASVKYLAELSQRVRSRADAAFNCVASALAIARAAFSRASSANRGGFHRKVRNAGVCADAVVHSVTGRTRSVPTARRIRRGRDGRGRRPRAAPLLFDCGEQRLRSAMFVGHLAVVPAVGRAVRDEDVDLVGDSAEASLQDVLVLAECPARERGRPRRPCTSGPSISIDWSTRNVQRSRAGIRP